MITDKDFAYYLTLFKLKDHETWRTHLCQQQQGFNRERKNWSGSPVVTEMKQYRIDRITGNMEEI